MMPLLLFFCALLFNTDAISADQIYFKIAVNEKSYSSFISNRVNIEKTPLNYMAARMRSAFFSPAEIAKDYYDVSVVSPMVYEGKDVVQYDIRPKYNDRFRQILIVDAKSGAVIHKDIYDTKGKLVFTFTSLEYKSPEKPETKDAPAELKPVCIRGFCLAGDRMMKDGTRHMMLSDGVNKFSVFRKKADGEVADSKRLVYGNYVLRKKSGDYVFTLVGTIPFNEMDNIIENYASLEVKQ